MIYAQIKNAIVKNIVVINDVNLEAVFIAGFDYLVRIDNRSENVALNWVYTPAVGETPDSFAAPTPPNPDYQKIYEVKINNAIIGFNKLIIQFAAANVLLGITQAGKTQLISDALKDVQRYGQSGSLYAVIASLQSIEVAPEMAPFLTAEIITDLISQTQDVINNL